jgi:hypothetical protein
MLIVLLSVGAVPVVVESVIPLSYPQQAAQSLKSDLLDNSSDLLDPHQQEMLSTFLRNDGDIALGKAYYPRYFEAGENLVDIRPEVLGKYEDRYITGHTEFYLIGSDTLWTVLKRLDVPEELAFGSEVFTIGCHQDGVVDAVAVFLLESGSASRVYWRDGLDTTILSCPLQAPIYSGEGS